MERRRRILFGTRVVDCLFELFQLKDAVFVGIGGAVCNKISVNRSKIFVNNQKIVVLDIFLVLCNL